MVLLIIRCMWKIACIVLGGLILLDVAGSGSAAENKIVCQDPAVSSEREACSGANFRTFARVINTCTCPVNAYIHLDGGGGMAIISVEANKSARQMIRTCSSKEEEFTYDFEFSCPGQPKQKPKQSLQPTKSIVGEIGRAHV